MAPRGMIAMATALLCITLGLFGPASAALGSHAGKSCCMTYNRKPVPFQRIKGYREQTAEENCHIEAIIFYTVKRNEICATRKDEWVRKILQSLSSKLKKMSKTAAQEAPKRKRDGGGSVRATETFLNSTRSFS